jgi:hypothetical protein
MIKIEEYILLPKEERRYHYIYKTKCVVTNKYYIGLHSTNNLNDGYIGSGKKLWYSIKKYGKENHICEIIEFLDSRIELKNRERELVNEDILKDPLCMNLKIGGEGGFDHINSSLTKEQRIKHGKSGKAKQMALLKNDTEHRETYCTSMRESMYRQYESGERVPPGISDNMLLMAQSPSAKQKRKDTLKKNKHQQGKKNSQYGTSWIYSLTEQKTIKISSTDIEKYLIDGWTKGRKKFT